MITVQEVTKSYGGFTAVDDVSFSAAAGRITGFLGPNGAGKSTTLRVLVGLTPPDAGVAHIDGHRFRDLPNPGREVGGHLGVDPAHRAGHVHPGASPRRVLLAKACAAVLVTVPASLGGEVTRK